MAIFNSVSILTNSFLQRLNNCYVGMFGKPGRRQNEYSNVINEIGTMAVELIATSNCLYHDVEHTMMVTLVGQEIIRGKNLLEGGVSARHWAHFTISLLCHDIGYVRGICPGDKENVAVINARGDTFNIPRDATDSALTPYHVERGEMFVRNRFAQHPVIDPEVIVRNIENTRFPVPDSSDSPNQTDWPGLVRAADLIGQMADPDYLRKLSALFYEFEETGTHKIIGCETAEDLREDYPNFYWTKVSQHVGAGIDYLRATHEGRRWLASLYSHIFSEEHRHAL